MIHSYLARRSRLWAVALFINLVTYGLGSTNDWQAHWIWADEDQGAEMLLARKTFSLGKAPDSAQLRITASSVYKLYVNGEYVRRGPARSTPHHQSFDAFDISGLLRKGENVLAVRVHYQEGSIAYHHEGRAGFLAQLDLANNDKKWSVLTDSGWSVLADPGWDNESPFLSRFHLEVADRVDKQKGPADWTSLKFDDSSWDEATPLMRKVGWPSVQRNAKPRALTPPWTRLEARDLPALKEMLVEPERELDPQLIKLDDLELSSKTKGDLQLMLYDFGEVVSGVPVFELTGDAGAIVQVVCAPYLVNGKLSPQVVQSVLVDQVILSGNRDKWEAMYFKPTRYMALVIEGASKPVELDWVGLRSVKYPFHMTGQLETPDDPWFSDCWSAAAKTIDTCTTDAYTDNYRERRQYVQTAYYAAIGNYWTFGDTALMRRCLMQAAEEQQANGLMPAYAPRHGEDFMVILDSNTAWFRGLHDYLLYSGDFESVRELIPAGRKLMDLLQSYTNELGMFDNPPYSYWLDHAVQDRRGANLCMNGHFLAAVQDWAELLQWMNEPDASEMAAKAENLKSSLRRNLWNEERGLFCDAYIDGKQSNLFSEHANAMALATGIATQQQADRIAKELLESDWSNYIKRDSGVVMVTPAMSYHLHDGLAKYGYARESLELFKERFGFMLNPEHNGTLWEEWWLGGSVRTGRLTRKGRTRSDAQTESAFPPALFGKYILGLQPIAPGSSEVQVSIPDCGMSRMSGELPTPQGTLGINWNLKKRELKLQVPEGTSVNLNFRTADGNTTLNKGNHNVKF